MNILHFNNKHSIAYNKHITAKRKAPYVIFHHGFMSDMNSTKALYIEKFCLDRGYNFIRFDNFGCGNSSGIFTDQTISSWAMGAQYVVDELAQGPVILVGSSLGAWIAALLASSGNNNIKGLITIAAAFDFTQDIIWDRLSPDQQAIFKQQGIFRVTGEKGDCSHSYPININLINDAKQHLLLRKKVIDITCPVHLIHGLQDQDVPYNISQQAAAKIAGNDVVLKLIKDGDHRLARPKDLKMIVNSIEEMLLN
jgi:pimeloyl-ACP methyl ester carboxylesterase